MMRRLHAAVNRTVLTVTGLALVLTGGLLAVAHTPLASRLPVTWLPPRPGGPLLDPDRLAALRAEGWWTTATTAASITATLLLALWSVRQYGGRARPLLPLPAPGGALRRRALEDALARRMLGVEGVARCRVGIGAPGRRRLRADVRVWLLPDTAPAAVLPSLTRLLAQAEEAAAPYTLNGRIRLSGRSHRMPHVR
ncbi:hypothetical protein [Streptomyces sp. NPDC096152]|uniref:hypothetical protein n=1 Tax=Streptomyces sp. NPDC096152 TaxID=3366078 RepID=UPI0037F4D8C9